MIDKLNTRIVRLGDAETPNGWGHPYPWVLIAPLEIEAQQAIE